MAGVLSVQGDMNDGTDLVAGNGRDAQLGHELVVAGGDGVAVHLGGDAVAGDFLDVVDTAPVQLGPVGFLQALADGVRGGAFGQGSVLNELGFVDGVVVDAHDLKDALGQGAGLIKDHIIGLGERLQIVGAFDQHAGVAGPADAGEKAEGDADDQGTGAADDQEGQGAVDPVAPGGGQTQGQHPHQGGQDGQGQSAVADGGGVDAGELGDEILRAGLAGGGVLH